MLTSWLDSYWDLSYNFVLLFADRTLHVIQQVFHVENGEIAFLTSDVDQVHFETHALV